MELNFNLIIGIFLGVVFFGIVIFPMAKQFYEEYTCEKETFVVTGIKSTSWSGTVYETTRGDTISSRLKVGDSFSRCVR